MRRALTLALVFAAWLAPAAAGQDKGTPVVGGGSFNSAPLLEPGTYRDTILPTEYLYYGFRLAAGQYLRVTVTLPDIASESVRRMGVIWLAGNIHTPTRTQTDVFHQREGDNDHIGFGGGPIDTLVVSSDDVSGEPDNSEDGAWRGAGVYYLALHATTGFGTTDPVRAEIPLTFHAEIVGEAAPNTTPTPSPTPTPSSEATATPAEPEERASDSGPSAAVAAVGGVGGLLIGVIAGIGRRRRRG